MVTEYNSRVHPKKFALWTGCGSITMMFAGLTSAYMVRRAQGDWVQFKFPEMFNYSTWVVVLSSIVLVLAYLAYRKQKIVAYRVGLFLTLVLGCLFGYLQYLGWQDMTNIGVELFDLSQRRIQHLDLLCDIAVCGLAQALNAVLIFVEFGREQAKLVEHIVQSEIR